MQDDFSRYYSGKTVVITGAAGFVASHLVELLLDNGAIVYGFDNFITGRQSNLDEVNNHSKADHFFFSEQDVRVDSAKFLDGIESIDAVFHLASPASPPRYQAVPIATYQVNAFATHQLLSYLHDHHPQARFLFASTSEVYGDPEQHPQSEEYWGRVNPNGLRSCYDESKRLGETICGIFERDKGMDVRIMRIFNTYGPRINPEDGRVIPNFISQALKGESLTIYGDGTQTRSYCYVGDLVRGIALMISKDVRGETINLGNPDEKTILETAEIINKLTGNDQGHTYQAMPQDDPTRRQPDVTKAQEKLNWQPTISFEEGIGQTIAYFKENESK